MKPRSSIVIKWAGLAILIPWLLSFRPPVAAAEGGADWSLQRCFDQAVTAAPKVLAGQRKLVEAGLTMADARVRFLPDLGVKVGYDAATEGGGWVGELLISDVFAGYHSFFEGRLAQIKNRISQLELDQVKLWLKHKVAQNYLNLLAGQKEAGLAAWAGQVRAEREAALRTLAARGLASPLAARRALLDLKAHQLATNKIEYANEDLTAQLKALLGLKQTDRLTIDPDQTFEQVLAQWPPISPEPGARLLEEEVSRLKTQAMRAEEEVLKWQRWPAPMVSAGWAQNTRFQKDGVFVIIGVQAPLFRAGRQERKIKRQGLKIAQQIQETEQIRRQALLRRAELVRNEDRLRERLLLLKELLALSEDEVKLRQEETDRGRLDFDAPLEAKLDVSRRKRELLAAELEWALNVVASRTLERATGP